MQRTHENNQHAEYLQHKPSVARNTGVVFEQLPLRSTDVRRNIDGVRINALYGFSLLGNHLSELGKNLAELRNRRLDGLNGCRAGLDIAVL